MMDLFIPSQGTFSLIGNSFILNMDFILVKVDVNWCEYCFYVVLIWVSSRLDNGGIYFIYTCYLVNI